MSAIIIHDRDMVVNKWNDDDLTPFRVHTTDPINHVEVEDGVTKLTPPYEPQGCITWCSGNTQMWQNWEVFEWLKGAWSETRKIIHCLCQKKLYSYVHLIHSLAIWHLHVGDHIYGHIDLLVITMDTLLLS